MRANYDQVRSINNVQCNRVAAREKVLLETPSTNASDNVVPLSVHSSNNTTARYGFTSAKRLTAPVGVSFQRPGVQGAAGAGALQFRRVSEVAFGKVLPNSKAEHLQNDRFISNRGATDIENANLLERLDTGGSVCPHPTPAESSHLRSVTCIGLTKGS